MENLIQFYSTLNDIKSTEDSIISLLREIHAPWVIKDSNKADENALIDQEVNDALHEMDLELEQLKKVEEILSKAKKVISKVDQTENTEPKMEHKKTTPPEKLPKPAIPTTTRRLPSLKQKSNENTLIAGKPTASQSTVKSFKPVYLNAPYKTQQSNTFKPTPRNTLSAKNTQTATKQATIAENMAKLSLESNRQPYQMQKSLSEDDIKRVLPPPPPITRVEPIKTFLPAITHSPYHPPAPEQTQIIFRLKDNGKELRLPPDLEDSFIKNYKLKQALHKQRSTNTSKNVKTVSKPTVDHEKNFIEKIENTFFTTNDSILNAHYFTRKFTTIYKNLTNLIQKYKPNGNALEFAEYLKVNLFSEILNDFDLKLSNEFKSFNLANLNVVNSDETIFDVQSKQQFNIDDDVASQLLETTTKPFAYKSVKELIKLNELKCLYIECKYKETFYSLVDGYLNEFLKMDSIETGEDIECFNLLYNLVTNKNSIIVQQ